MKKVFTSFNESLNVNTNQTFTMKDEPLITRLWATQANIYDDFKKADSEKEVENAYKMSERKYKERIQQIAAAYFAKFRLKQLQHKNEPIDITIDELFDTELKLYEKYIKS